MGFIKHRDEKLLLEIDLTNRLQSETITVISALRIHNEKGINVTSEFGNLNASIVSSVRVHFTVNAAVDQHQQRAGLYEVFLKVTTSDGSVLVETPDLTETDEASIL